MKRMGILCCCLLILVLSRSLPVHAQQTSSSSRRQCRFPGNLQSRYG